MFDIRHGERVRSLVEGNPGGTIIGVGRLGTVRNLRKAGDQLEYEIKWDGRQWPTVLLRHQIERATG